jgi:hypothetical protein
MADENLLLNSFINYLYQIGDLSIPTDFHSQCNAICKMVNNDVTGVVNTILDFAVNSASETKYKIESENPTLEKLFDLWLSQININIDGVPTGLQQLSKEYLRERWQGSSLCLLRVSTWKDITADGTTIKVPTVLWFVNGSSIYIKRPTTKDYKLGSDKYFLCEDLSKDTLLPQGKNEEIIIQKPFSRWFDKYPTPFLVKKGVLKNFLTFKALNEKIDQVVSKILPYLFIINKGSLEQQKLGISYDDKELNALLDQLKERLEKINAEKGRTPAVGNPYDQSYQHLIPDLKGILSEELYSHTYREILSGLGFVDIIQGISSTRKESVLNPKPFLTELNNGVIGFKDMLMEVINLIVRENKLDHKKFFTDGKYLEIVNSPLKVNTEAILDIVRSAYDRGTLSIQTYIESTGFDFETEIERRRKELEDGIEDLMYPHLTQNLENIPDRGGAVVPAKPKNEKNLKNKTGPESKNFKNAEEEASIQEDLVIAPYDKSNPPAFLKKYPAGAIDTFITVFNESFPKGEDYAFPVAWTALKRWMKKHGYRKEGKEWVKAEEQVNE